MKTLSPAQIALRERYKPVVDRAPAAQESKDERTLAAEKTLAQSEDMKPSPTAPALAPEKRIIS